MIIPVVGMLWLDDQWNFGRPGIWFVPLAVVFSVLACAEFVQWLQALELRPVSWAVQVGTLLVTVSPAVTLWAGPPAGRDFLEPFLWTLLALAAGAGLVVLTEMRRFEKPGRATIHIAVSVFAMVYIGVLLGFLFHLRLLHPNRTGLFAVFSVVFVVKLSDTGAYFTGRTFGRRKMAPVISPGKTIEGAAGGLLTACLASIFLFQFAADRFLGPSNTDASLWMQIGYGATIAVAGILGDLTESLLKRDVGRKDSSSWLPGLGGVLDILDSLLVAAPVAYIWWAAGGLGG